MPTHETSDNGWFQSASVFQIVDVINWFFFGDEDVYNLCHCSGFSWSKEGFVQMYIGFVKPPEHMFLLICCHQGFYAEKSSKCKMWRHFYKVLERFLFSFEVFEVFQNLKFYLPRAVQGLCGHRMGPKPLFLSLGRSSSNARNKIIFSACFGRYFETPIFARLKKISPEWFLKVF